MEDSTIRKFRNVAGWYALLAAFVAGAILTYIKVKFIFYYGRNAEALIFGAEVLCVAELVLSLYSLPKPESFLALIFVGVISYFLLFTSLYAIP